MLTDEALLQANVVFVFHSFLEYFLSPKRQQPQLGCHLNSIIPPLPGGALRRCQHAGALSY